MGECHVSTSVEVAVAVAVKVPFQPPQAAPMVSLAGEAINSGPANGLRIQWSNPIGTHREWAEMLQRFTRMTSFDFSRILVERRVFDGWRQPVPS